MNHIPFIVGYMWVAYGLYLVYMWAILENDSLVKGIISGGWLGADICCKPYNRDCRVSNSL